MELAEEIAAYVRDEVVAGRRNCVEIAHWASKSYFVGKASEGELHGLALAAAGPAFADHLAAQATWPDVTDNDRLTAAFAELDRAGIVTREDFTQTLTDGRYEIRGEAARREDARGWAFYHEQDVSSCIAGNGLNLAYGAVDQDGDTVAIGHEIVKSLQANSLTVEWDGDAATRIRVVMPWRKRRSGAMAAAPPYPHPAGDIEGRVDREGWDGDTAPPPWEMSTALLAGLYLPLMPRGAKVIAWPGEHGQAEITWEGDQLRVVLTYWTFPADDEPLTWTTGPFLVDPADAWSVLRHVDQQPDGSPNPRNV
jgi:hypothetical protein